MLFGFYLSLPSGHTVNTTFLRVSVQFGVQNYIIIAAPAIAQTRLKGFSDKIESPTDKIESALRQKRKSAGQIPLRCLWVTLLSEQTGDPFRVDVTHIHLSGLSGGTMYPRLLNGDAFSVLITGRNL
jgi:hypothetical protein